MSALNLSSLFAASVLAATFDDVIEDQARSARIYAPLVAALEVSYGISLPVATAPAVKYANNMLFSLEKAPVLAKGLGAKAATVTVIQALHAYLCVVVSNMSAKHAPLTVAPLPAWADPVAIAAKKQANKDARQAKANDDAANALADSPEVSAEDAALVASLSAPLRDLHAEMLAAWAAFSPFLSQGVATVAERDSFIAQIEVAITKAEPQAESVKGAIAAKAKSKKARKVDAPVSAPVSAPVADLLAA